MTYLVRQADVKPYSPANHSGTRNYRLIGPETVGARQVEMILGEIEKGKGAHPHLHTGIEQVCYLLEGTAHVEVGGGEIRDAGGRRLLLPRRRAARLHRHERARESPCHLLPALP